MMLISALACALQVAASTLPPPLPVLVGDRRRTVPVVRAADGALAIRADLLGDALGGQFLSDGGTRYHLLIAGTRIDVEVGSAFARLSPDTLTLESAVYREGGRVFLPYAFATEMVPRVVTGILFDTEKGELRRFGDVTARRSAAPSNTAVHSPAPRPASPTSVSASSPRVSTNRQRVVVVDAGHGCVDKGMSGPMGSANKVYEKNITFAVSRELKSALERRGIQVVMTRKSDTLIALNDRGRIANQAKGDLFMSVHVNAANPRWPQPAAARGYETYFLAEAKTEDERRVEAMENEVIKFETTAATSTDDPLGFIIRDMAQNEHLRESARLAELVQAQMGSIHPGPNRGVKQAGFRVLVTAFMPAVLVEIGFGTNRAESAYMSDAASQRALAEKLADAVEAFLAQYERKVGGGN
jgi:N-acetylmuramoyl-L-alanine amidase